MRVMITGISGFVGHHLLARLVELGDEVLGLDIRSPQGCGDLRVITHDLTGPSPLDGVLQEAEPDRIYHLAAVYGNVTRERMHAVNVGGTAKLVEGIRASGISTSLFLASSSAVYGPTLPRHNPISEARPTAPNTDYGETKLEQESIALRSREEWGLQVSIARTFNLNGPGLPPSLLPSRVARAIALCEAGNGSGEIHVGDLRPRRDYVDVRDAVEAYVRLMSAGKWGTIYNVCSGVSHSMREVVDNLLKMARVPVGVKQIPDPARDREVRDQIGDFARLRADTGWTPRIPFGQSLACLLEDWRSRLDDQEG